MVDLTELEGGQAAAQRHVQVDGALVRGESEELDPEMLRAVLRGLRQLEATTGVPARTRSPASTVA